MLTTPLCCHASSSGSRSERLIWGIWRGREGETRKNSFLTGGLNLLSKVKNLKTWPFCKGLLIFEASKRESSTPGPCPLHPGLLSASTKQHNCPRRSEPQAASI